MLRRLLPILALTAPLSLGQARAAVEPRPAEPQGAAATPAPAGEAAAPGESELPFRPGPAKIELGHDLELDLPSDFAFLPPKQADALLRKAGNLHNEGLLGLVVEKDKPYFVVIDFSPEGYIKDDEKIDAADLLKTIREGIEESNKERVQQGFKPLTAEGWSEEPRYDKAKHHLVWALLVSDPEGKSVNFNTRVLGRRGFVSLNLVTDPARLGEDKAGGAKLLAATQFKKGARYEDFDAKTDKVAEYGLVGLILGGAGLGAAKLVKLGLLAKFGKVLLGLLLAGKKLVVLLLVGIGAFVKRLFGGKQDPPAPPSGAPPPGEPPPTA